MLFTETDSNRSLAHQPPAKKARIESVPRILDGKFYTIESNVDEKITAKCIQCGEIKKGNRTSTGNFINHYRSRHSDSVKQLDEYLQGNSTGIKQSTLTQMTLPRISATVSKEAVMVFLSIMFFNL